MKRRNKGWPGRASDRHSTFNVAAIDRAIAQQDAQRSRDPRCDCQAPDAPTGARLVSMECPVHNENPYPPDE